MRVAGFRTNYLGWGLAAGCLFIALGFVDPVVGVAKGDNSLWAYVHRFVTGDYYCDTWDIVVPILVGAALRAIAATTLGWVFQAVVVAARSSRRARAAHNGVAPDDGGTQGGSLRKPL